MERTRTVATERDAPWKQRFRVSTVAWCMLARERPERGLAVSNRSGRFELYAWDVPSGHLRQLTDRPEGTLFGFISPDGRHVYYLDDLGGDEIGHLVWVPFAGGPPEDVTPHLPPYATFGGAVSDAGNLLAFTLADEAGFALVATDLAPDDALGEPRALYRTEHLCWAPVVSPDGELAVVASTERTGMQHFSLLAFDARTGERVAELWDGPETSVEAVAFDHRREDRGQLRSPRLAGTSDQSGYRRPLVWSPMTGERRDLLLDGLDGDLVPLDWSPDGDWLLLMQTSHASTRLWSYDLRADAVAALDHPPGSYGGASFAGSRDEVWAHWQDSTHPPQVIALDTRTGARTRTLLAAGEAPPSRPWRSVTFRSSDGQEIQGWLGLPAGEGPFPAILYTHGGP